MKFQSTLPVGGATVLEVMVASKVAISIHAPRGGSDYFKMTLCYQLYDFNPRSPWGERR